MGRLRPKNRVHLGKPGTVYASASGALAWLGLKKSSMIELELRMQPGSSERKGMVELIVVMRSLVGELPSDPSWKARCDRIFTDLRAYVMGK